jgi:hypothetical protein
MSLAAADLGLGGSLAQQVKDETDEDRRKRLLAQRQQLLAGASGDGAVNALLGGRGANAG